MTVLLTGYEPFDDHDTTPSGAIARDLDGGTVAGHEVVGRVLPVEFDAVRDELAALLDDHDPAAVLGPTSARAVHASMSLDVQRRGVTAAVESMVRC